jgi:hypothetical protein
MNYSEFVAKNAKTFSQTGLLKTAEDLAAILDNELFALKKGTDNFEKYFARDREEVFDKFCFVCVKAAVPVPPLEPELYLVLLPDQERLEKEKVEEGKKIFHEVFSKLRGRHGKQAESCRALAKTLLLFSGERYGEPERDRLIGFMNYNLVELGLDPIRPDYSEMKYQIPTSVPAPEKPTTVLIFDDSDKELMNTGRSLAGWPNINFVFCRFKKRGFDFKGEEKEAAIREATEIIMGLTPDIVLMDQGLGPINGSDVVRKVIELFPEKHPVFVPNTGGEPNELRNAGALYTNCDKGRHWDAIKEAFAYIKK